MPTPRIRVLAVAVAAAALVLVMAPSAPALAAPAASSTGWIRVAHLSPDTRSMDVRLASLGGTSAVISVDNVSYGDVSSYRTLAAGRYALAMVPAGSPAGSTPVVQSLVTVSAGSASTIAVFGRNAHLTTKVIGDTLTLPKPGDARVRVVQASTSSTPVTVTASSSGTLVSDAPSASVSPYADVRAGSWRLTAVRGSVTTTSTIDLKVGQIATVFVLDDASGGLVLSRVLDSASVGGVPTGYLATGGGYLAHQADQQDALLALLAGGIGLVAASGTVGAVAMARRRRARA